MYTPQGCALRKISGSPSGSQAFYLSRLDLKVSRPNKKFRGALWAPKHSSWGAQASQVGRPSTSDDHVFFTHTNLTGLLITKLGNFSFWVRQKPACCLMKPIKVFVPFRFKTRNVRFQQVYVNFIKIFGSRKTVLFTSNTKLANKFSKGESMRHEI